MKIPTNKQSFIAEFMEELLETLGGAQSREMFSAEDAVQLASEVLNDMINEENYESE